MTAYEASPINRNRSILTQLSVPQTGDTKPTSAPGGGGNVTISQHSKSFAWVILYRQEPSDYIQVFSDKPRNSDRLAASCGRPSLLYMGVGYGRRGTKAKAELRRVASRGSRQGLPSDCPG